MKIKNLILFSFLFATLLTAGCAAFPLTPSQQPQASPVFTALPATTQQPAAVSIPSLADGATPDDLLDTLVADENNGVPTGESIAAMLTSIGARDDVLIAKQRCQYARPGDPTPVPASSFFDADFIDACTHYEPDKSTVETAKIAGGAAAVMCLYSGSRNLYIMFSETGGVWKYTGAYAMNERYENVCRLETAGQKFYIVVCEELGHGTGVMENYDVWVRSDGTEALKYPINGYYETNVSGNGYAPDTDYDYTSTVKFGGAFAVNVSYDVTVTKMADNADVPGTTVHYKETWTGGVEAGDFTCLSTELPCGAMQRTSSVKADAASWGWFNFLGDFYDFQKLVLDPSPSNLYASLTAGADGYFTPQSVANVLDVVGELNDDRETSNFSQSASGLTVKTVSDGRQCAVLALCRDYAYLGLDTFLIFEQDASGDWQFTGTCNIWGRTADNAYRIEASDGGKFWLVAQSEIHTTFASSREETWFNPDGRTACSYSLSGDAGILFNEQHSPTMRLGYNCAAEFDGADKILLSYNISTDDNSHYASETWRADLTNGDVTCVSSPISAANTNINLISCDIVGNYERFFEQTGGDVINISHALNPFDLYTGLAVNNDRNTGVLGAFTADSVKALFDKVGAKYDGPYDLFDKQYSGVTVTQAGNYQIAVLTLSMGGNGSIIFLEFRRENTPSGQWQYLGTVISNIWTRGAWRIVTDDSGRCFIVVNHRGNHGTNLYCEDESWYDSSGKQVAYYPVYGSVGFRLSKDTYACAYVDYDCTGNVTFDGGHTISIGYNFTVDQEQPYDDGDNRQPMLTYPNYTGEGWSYDMNTGAFTCTDSYVDLGVTRTADPTDGVSLAMDYINYFHQQALKYPGAEIEHFYDIISFKGMR